MIIEKGRRVRFSEEAKYWLYNFKDTDRVGVSDGHIRTNKDLIKVIWDGASKTEKYHIDLIEEIK